MTKRRLDCLSPAAELDKREIQGAAVTNNYVRYSRT